MPKSITVGWFDVAFLIAAVINYLTANMWFDRDQPVVVIYGYALCCASINAIGIMVR